MKKIRFYNFIAALVGLFIFTACGGSDEDGDIPQPEDTSSYNVHIEINAQSISGKNITTTNEISYSFGSKTKNEKGEFKGSGLKIQKFHFPCKKGDRICLKMSMPLMNLHAKIKVLKNNVDEDYVVKAEAKQDNSITLEYTIDY